MIGSKKKLPNINGYQVLEEWTTSGSARWSFAEKSGRQWFIKEFMAPKYKNIEDGISPSKVESSRIRCEKFRKDQEAIYKRIRMANNGNIVIVDDFFSFESQFYAVSEKVDVASVSIVNIAKMKEEQKLVLLKVLTHSLDRLHKFGVVHADLKPDNVLIKRTLKGYTLKLIDFDTSFLEEHPKRGEEIGFDIRFVAPETMAAYMDESISLTTKIDIFTLGILFHLYYVGKMPAIPEKYHNICEAVCDGVSPKIDSSIPLWLNKLIKKMLELDPKLRPDAEIVFSTLVAKKDFENMEKVRGFHPPERIRKQ